MALEGPDSFAFIRELTWESWLLVLASSALTLSTQIYKFQAFKFYQVSKLQQLAFVPNIW